MRLAQFPGTEASRMMLQTPPQVRTRREQAASLSCTSHPIACYFRTCCLFGAQGRSAPYYSSLDVTGFHTSNCCLEKLSGVAGIFPLVMFGYQKSHLGELCKRNQLARTAVSSLVWNLEDPGRSQGKSFLCAL